MKISAQNNQCPGGSQGGQFISVEGILCRITNILKIIFYGLVIIMFIIVGFLYLTAQGEPNKIQRANRALLWAIVGVVVGILSYSANVLVYNLIWG